MIHSPLSVDQCPHSVFGAHSHCIHGANINAVTVNGETALMLAASNEKSDLVAFLLQKGADPKLLDKSGKGALDYARSANIDDDLKKAMKCCEPDKEKTIAILTKAVK